MKMTRKSKSKNKRKTRGGACAIPEYTLEKTPDALMNNMTRYITLLKNPGSSEDEKQAAKKGIEKTYIQYVDSKNELAKYIEQIACLNNKLKEIQSMVDDTHSIRSLIGKINAGRTNY